MKSNREWIQWGQRDPLFGVASWPEHERGGSQAWTDDAFYELGRSDWADFVGRWITYGLDTSCCVEIGSGAGRLTKHLAATFDQVLAVDVSAEMLVYAKEHIDADNVSYLVTGGVELPLADGSATAAFSTHVFQHFDGLADAARVFAEVARVLGSKGSLMVHMPMHAFPAGRTGMRLLYAARKQAGDLRGAGMRLAAGLGLARPPMRGLSYEVAWLLEVLGELGFTDVEFAFFSVTANQDLHSFVFARKR